MKVVINACFGGFSLSEKAMIRFGELKGKTVYIERDKYGMNTYWTVPPEQQMPYPENWCSLSKEERENHSRLYAERTLCNRTMPRNDADLVRVVEELGDAANGECAELEIVEIPDEVGWEISEYDGNEHVAETHRTWR